MNWLNKAGRSMAGCRFGTWVKLPTSETVEMIGHAGLDFVVVDMEHAPHDVRSAHQAILVAQGHGMAALVRLPDQTASIAQKLLDTGADGVLLPRVEGSAAARAAFAALCFPPVGTRGMGYTSRAARWGADGVADYLARGRDGITRVAQLEDRAAIDEVEAIAQIPGLDALFIGFGDLMLSTGLPRGDVAILDMERRVLEAGRARQLPVGTAVQTAREARACADAGYGFVMVSADTTIFASGIRAIARELAAG